MTTLHVREMGDLAVVRREELEKLLALARRFESVTVEVEAEQEEDAPSTREIAAMMERSSAWQWLRDEPDLYSAADAQPL